MNIGIIGNGAREHSLCYWIKKSKKVKKIFCFPGNAGTDDIANNINIDPNNFKKLNDFILKNNIKILIVGPEEPLVNGVVDFFEKKGIKLFGPNKLASKLEGSKIFTKKLCKKFNIPTAKFNVCNSKKNAFNFLKKCKFPVVIKADGLAAGKGVYICKTNMDARKAINEIFDGKFGKLKKVLFEEFLQGEEMSFFIISDGKNFKKFGTAQDHKRVGVGDVGPNTGGMGAYSPSRLENKILDKKIIDKIIKPTLMGLRKQKIIFKGFLYAGLMIVKNEPYLIEYNVRMGDPECQTILPRLQSNFFNIIQASINGNLNKTKIKWNNRKTLSIVLCSKGYPNKYKKNIVISNLNSLKLASNQFIFHAGTKKNHSKIFSAGGRVLNFISITKSFKESRLLSLNLIKKLNWKYGFFRKDIGYKVINE
jgi:phosphoribosylamine--glycine ligase